MSFKVGELNASINLDNHGFNRGIDQSESKMRGFGSRVSGMASSIAPAAAAIGLSFGAVAAGVTGLALKAVTLSANMEQSRIAFTTMLGDAKKADKFIRDMQKFAASTPFEFVGLQENAKRLLAMGFAAKDIIPVLTNVGDAVAALGSGDAGLNNITYALGQMKTAGKVHTQDMMQLTNAGVSAWQMLADKLGVTVAVAQKRVQAGTVSSATGLDAIMLGMHTKYGGLMSKQSHTMTGLFSNLTDIATQSLTIVGDSIASTFDIKGKIGAATGFIQAVTDGFKKGGGAGVFRAILEQLFSPAIAKDTFAKISKAVGSLGDAFGRVGRTIGGALAGPMAALRGFLGNNLDSVLMTVAGIVGGVLTASFAALAITVLAATWPLLAIGAGIGLLALGAYQLYKHWGTVMQVFKPFIDIVGPKLKELWDKLQPSIQRVREAIKPIAEEFGRAFKEWAPILKVVGDILQKFLGGLFSNFINVLEVVIPAAIAIVIGAFKALGYAFDAVAAALQGDWGRAWKDIQSMGAIRIDLSGGTTSKPSKAPPSEATKSKAAGGHGLQAFDSGGLFKGKSPQAVTVGENRPEMVGALDDVFPMMIQAIRKALPGKDRPQPLHTQAQADSESLRNEIAMLRQSIREMRGGGSTVNAPISVRGSVNPRRLARELALEFQ